jgi:hypothetical protein
LRAREWIGNSKLPQARYVSQTENINTPRLLVLEERRKQKGKGAAKRVFLLGSTVTFFTILIIVFTLTYFQEYYGRPKIISELCERKENLSVNISKKVEDFQFLNRKA